MLTQVFKMTSTRCANLKLLPASELAPTVGASNLARPAISKNERFEVRGRPRSRTRKSGREGSRGTPRANEGSRGAGASATEPQRCRTRFGTYASRSNLINQNLTQELTRPTCAKYSPRAPYTTFPQVKPLVVPASLTPTWTWGRWGHLRRLRHLRPLSPLPDLSPK